MEDNTSVFVLISYDVSDRMLFHGVFSSDDSVDTAVQQLEKDYEDRDFDIYEVPLDKVLMTGDEWELVVGNSD